MAAKIPAYNGKGKYVFVSYSHKDSRVVYPVILSLHEQGYNVWYDEGIPLVVNYGGELYRRIKGCSVFLLFVSKNSVASDDVNKEVENAFALKKTVVRINIDDSPMRDSWCYHIPPTSQYISINAEPGEFYSKLCQAIAECRDPQKPTDRKPQEAPAHTPAPAPAAVREKSANSAVAPAPKKAEKKAETGKNGKIIAAVLAVVLIIGAVVGGIAIANRKPVGDPAEDQPFDQRLEEIEGMADDLREQEEIYEPSAELVQEEHTEDDIDEYEFALVEGGYEIKNYAGRAKELTLPSEYKGEPVVSIGKAAFARHYGLESVAISDGVASIGEKAFDSCVNLKSVMIPDAATSIGDHAFSGCSSLTSITIPDGMTNIGSYAFYGCSSLIRITIPDSVTNIGEWAFWRSGISSITIPDGVTSIKEGAFANCNLTIVTIPDGVTSIEKYAFDNCYGLKTVTIPDSVTSIGYSAFSGFAVTVRAPHNPSYYGYNPGDGVTWVVE